MILLLLAGLLVTLLYAGAETALSALMESSPDTRREPLPWRLERLLLEPEIWLQTLVVGKLTALVVTGACLVTIARGYVGPAGLGVAMLLFVPIMAFAAALLPKAALRRRPDTFLGAVALPLWLLSVLAMPLVRLGNGTGRLVTAILEPLLGIRAGAAGSSEEAGSHTGEGLSSEEDDLVEGILEFSRTLVQEVMVPRRDIVALNANAEMSSALEVVRESKYSRIPVFRGGIENVVGILHAKDLLPYTCGLTDAPFSLMAVVRKPFYVPGVMTLDDLLTEFQLSGNHMAFVVDEFGGTSGLVTLEDILEEIVGEIQDEHDFDEQPVRRIGRSTWIAEGTAELDTLEELLHVEFPEERCETVGGFVFQRLGHLPVTGERCSFGELVFEVTRMESRRVGEVRISPAPKRERAR